MIRCTECGFKNENPKSEKRFRKYEGKGYSFEIEVETPSCEKCKTELYYKKTEEAIRRIAHKKIIISQANEKNLCERCGFYPKQGICDSEYPMLCSGCAKHMRNKKNERLSSSLL